VTGKLGAAWVAARRELMPFRSLAAALIAYAILRVVYAHVVGIQGFTTDDGSLDRGLAAFALVMLVLRITILVAVPLIVTYRVIERLLAPRPRP
jgi:hypothetical protein